MTDDDELLTKKSVCKLMNCSISMLDRMRIEKIGPPEVSLKRKPRFPRFAYRKWVISELESGKFAGDAGVGDKATGLQPPSGTPLHGVPLIVASPKKKRLGPPLGKKDEPPRATAGKKKKRNAGFGSALVRRAIRQGC
jgi:hypothetical protein